MKRIFLIVLDSCGIGQMPDSDWMTVGPSRRATASMMKDHSAAIRQNHSAGTIW